MKSPAVLILALLACGAPLCQAALFDTAASQGPNVEKSTLLIKLFGTQKRADNVARHLFEQLDSNQVLTNIAPI